MSSSNCCFLTCIQVSQEVGQVVWYSHLFQNFQQFSVIHTVKGFGIVNKTEIDVFLELPTKPGRKCSLIIKTIPEDVQVISHDAEVKLLFTCILMPGVVYQIASKLSSLKQQKFDLTVSVSRNLGAA